MAMGLKGLDASSSGRRTGRVTITIQVQSTGVVCARAVWSPGLTRLEAACGAASRDVSTNYNCRRFS